jgi:hypothetical protein
MTIRHLPSNAFDEPGRRPAPPVTLPTVKLRDVGGYSENEIKAAARRFVEVRTVKLGLDAWQSITKAETFEAWKRIGLALSIGKQHALRVTGANQAWRQHYSREFGGWMKEHGFDKMPKPTRSVAIEFHENIDAIAAWRATLTERQRQRLCGPLQNVRRWRRETADRVKRIEDAQKTASAAWSRFVRCVEALPQEQAAPLWREAFQRSSSNLQCTQSALAFSKSIFSESAIEKSLPFTQQ